MVRDRIEIAEIRKKRILALLQTTDLTQKEIAERLGVTRGCIAKVIANNKQQEREHD